jgi:hypothetical protein
MESLDEPNPQDGKSRQDRPKLSVPNLRKYRDDPVVKAEMDRRHRLWAGMLVEAGFGTNASVVETPDGDGADAEGVQRERRV